MLKELGKKLQNRTGLFCLFDEGEERGGRKSGKVGEEERGRQGGRERWALREREREYLML